MTLPSERKSICRQERFLRSRRGIALWAAALALAGCSIGTDLDDFPATARIRVEGSAPEPLKLIVSTRFFEQINLETLQRYAVLDKADTIEVAFPYDQTWDIRPSGSVYVELLYEHLPTATVRFRVNLDNGQSYDQSATLSDHAALIYYWVWVGQTS